MRGQPARPVRDGGLRKRVGGNTFTAPQADRTMMLRSSTSRAGGWCVGACRKAWMVLLVFTR